MKQIRKAWITKCLGQNYSISPRNKFILREFDRFLLSHSALHDFYKDILFLSKSLVLIFFLVLSYIQGISYIVSLDILCHPLMKAFYFISVCL